jgi:hypothetical protein
LNGILDRRDIEQGASQGCQSNGIPDECDILLGTSQDTNGNGVPDECELCPDTPRQAGLCVAVAPPPLLPDPSGLDKNRFITFATPTGGTAAQRARLCQFCLRFPLRAAKRRDRRVLSLSVDFSRFSAREGSATSATAGWLAFSGNFGHCGQVVFNS